ncbi:tyrosine-type recombinase/integrase [Chryseobacterium oryctis]|uniref:Tyrosine-type recombinase/integrase n=1 Tax=Chryseobacterium oryctis TaxID=2952618 RepID=A0ABT3HSW4_9FLAO|nr:tyrosine-type recombinase/integrase [Chryseobacterium oryctis]MCW3162867.1 tyrosine-type recombinase/integrase [Chryseobacterium oryctis]
MENFRRYLELRNYQKKNVKRIVAIAKEYEEYREKGNLPKEYIGYLKLRKNKNNPEKLLSNGTVNNYLTALKLYKNYRKNIERKETNLVICRSLKTYTPKIEIVSPEEIQSLFEATVNTRDKAVLCCLYYLGLRAGEAAELLLEDVDLENAKALVRKSKTGYQREVPIHSKARDIFEEYLLIREHKGEGFLQGLKGNLTTSGIEFIIDKTAEKSKIKKRIYPHLLRHSIATHLLKNGMELKKVSLFLGHRSLESTQRYTHL